MRARPHPRLLTAYGWAAICFAASLSCAALFLLMK